MRAFALFSVAVLVLAGVLAGCIGRKDAPSKPLDTAATNQTAAQNATLPDGRGESLGNKETNKTVNGTFGVQHKHDYWKGRDSIVVFQGDVPFDPIPLFPDGPGSTSPRDEVFLKLPNTTQVFEGTDKVTVLAATPVNPETNQPDLAPPTFYLQYRSAADSDWRPPQTLTPGTPLAIPVAPKETDMPHSVSSLWVFRLTTDRVAHDLLNLTITAHKGREVVNWPGHPSFYGASNVRRVADNKHVKTHVSGIESLALYDSAGTWASPDKLVSYGTDHLVVFMNVTAASATGGVPPAGFFLETHNATIIGPEIEFGDRYFDVNKKNDLKSYEFIVPVDMAGMDGPYQPASRWGFRLMATFAETPVTGLCPGCVDYDVEYDMTILAVHDPAKNATMMM